MSWRRYEPVDDDNARAGAQMAFGRPMTVRPRLQDAKVVLALDADPLGPGPEQIANARAYAARRKPDAPDAFSRWYVAEGGWSLTGANADHRLALRPDRIADVALALAAALGQGGAHAVLAPEAQRFVGAAAADLKANVGHAVVLVGRSQPPQVHALVDALNAQLKAPVDAHDPIDPYPDGHMASLHAAASDLASGRVETLIVLGGDPAYAAPGALDLASAVAKAPFSVHFSEHLNDTSAACQWSAPLSHVLESWGGPARPRRDRQPGAAAGASALRHPHPRRGARPAGRQPRATRRARTGACDLERLCRRRRSARRSAAGDRGLADERQAGRRAVSAGGRGQRLRGPGRVGRE